MKRPIVILAAGCALMLAIPIAAAAQGFSVNEHGTCSMARGGTGVASPCGDGSTINFNPSGIAGITGGLVGVGVTAIQAKGSFTDDLTLSKDELQNGIIPVPHAYFAYGINDKLAAGFGFFVPYGLGTIWENTFEGRFNGYDNDLRSMYFQPTLAYQPHEKIKIGAGFDFVVASLKLTQRVDLSAVPAPAPAPPGLTLGQFGVPFHTDFANATLTAHGATGMGGNFGITVEPVDGFSIGARYLMRVKLDYEGDAEFEAVSTGLVLPAGNPFGVPAGTPVDLLVAGEFQPGSQLGNQGVETSITMPDQATVGVAVDVSQSLMLLVDWQWMNWSVFDELPLTFENQAEGRVVHENYEDTHGIRVGLDWNNGDRLSVRGGYIYHNGAAPPQTVTPLLPEGDRNEFTGGFGLKLTDNLTADFAYQFLKQNDRRGRVREPEGTAALTPADADAINSGLYTFSGHLFGVTLSVRF
jgi:long-chain fatty acid transport protein